MAKEQYNQNLIRNAKLVPMTNNQDDFGITNNGAIAIDGDQIVWSGKEKDIPEKYKKYNEFNAKGKLITPGLIDCHTHLVFGGNRSNEFNMRLNGKSYQEIAKAGGVAGICPVTEANLGDGIFNGFQYNEQKGLYGIGTDSNINISLTEELKTFEYSQRLLNKKRAVISNQKKSTGRKLFDDCLEGGARALQINNGKIQKGYFADFMNIKNHELDFIEIDEDSILDYLIFASPKNIINNVWVKGKCLVKDGVHINSEKIKYMYKISLSKIISRL